MATTIINFVVSLLYSKMFLPEEFGEYTLVYSMYCLISSVMGGWLTMSVIRKASEYNEKDRLEELLGNILKLHFILSAIFLGISLICAVCVRNNFRIRFIILIFGIYYFFEYLVTIINYIYRFYGDAKKYSKSIAVCSLLKVVMLYIIYFLFNEKSIISLPLSLLLGEFIWAICISKRYKVLKKIKENRISLTIVKDIFMFGFPLIGNSMVSWVLNVSDRYVINFYSSTEEVGIYAYAYQMGNAIVSVFANFIMLGAYSEIVTTWERDGQDKTCNVIKKYLSVFLALVVPLSMGIIMVGKNFFSVIVGEKYFVGYDIFILVCLSGVILGLTQYTNKAWELTNNTKTILKLNIIVSLFNLILNILFIPKYGYKFAAVSTLMAYILLLVLSVKKSYKILPVKIDLISLGKVILSTGVMGISIYLFNNFCGYDLYLKLLLEIFIGILVYFVMLLILGEIKNLLKRMHSE